MMLNKAAGLIAAISLFTILACGQYHPTDRPNFILFIADDMAWDDCGAYGHPGVRTPNIDRLAREGMRFDSAFLTISSCSPSRSSIITGRYPHNTGAEQLHWPLPTEQVTFVEKLRASGYWTAAAGKWHLGDAVKDRFDLVVGENPADVPDFQGQKSKPDGSGCTAWVPVLQSRPKQQPFFLWLAAKDPHRGYQVNTITDPHQPADVRLPPYVPDTPETRADYAMYYDEIARLDNYVGMVLAELQRQDAADNTFVLFISDNGRPFPRDKTTLYDSGIKTPWIVRWPVRVKGGTISNSLVSSVDIAPTILQLAGIQPSWTFMGKSFSATLTNTGSEIRDFIYAESHWHDFDNEVRAVRSVRFKYIRHLYTDIPLTPPADAIRGTTFQTMRKLRDENRLHTQQMVSFRQPRPDEELYDVSADPFELTNLANDPQYSDTLKKMRAALADWQKSSNDIIPKIRTPDEFERETGKALPKHHGMSRLQGSFKSNIENN